MSVFLTGCETHSEGRLELIKEIIKEDLGRKKHFHPDFIE